MTDQANMLNTCVRYPPTVFPMQSQNQLTQEVSMSVTPLPIYVAADYWCGEYKKKEIPLQAI